MRIRNRIDVIEQILGVGEERVLTVIWNGDEQGTRQRVEAARADGCRIRVIRYAVMDVAETPKEAESKLLGLRERWPEAPVKVYSRRAPGEELLASFTPPLSEWLTQAEQASGDADF